MLYFSFVYNISLGFFENNNDSTEERARMFIDLVFFGVRGSFST